MKKKKKKETGESTWSRTIGSQKSEDQIPNGWEKEGGFFCWERGHKLKKTFFPGNKEITKKQNNRRPRQEEITKQNIKLLWPIENQKSKTKKNNLEDKNNKEAKEN